MADSPPDQADVGALLGQVGDPPGPPRPLIFSRFRRDFENLEIRTYDFKRPERVGRDQMRALHTLHDGFGRALGATLSGLLRMIVEIRVAQAEQMTFSEFTAALPNPTSFNLIEAKGLDGQLCLELSPLVVYPLIDRLLGGTDRELFIPQREMTAIEVRIIREVLDRAMAALGEAWKAVRPLSFTVARMESNPQVVQIVAPNEVVVVIGFEIRMGSRAGTMSLCIPYKTIEPLVADLATRSWAVSGDLRSSDRLRGTIAGHLAGASLDLVAILARTTITLSELRTLERGDLIVTGHPLRSPVVVTLSGSPKFLARVGHVRGRRAIQIVRPVEPSDRL